jgi:hypothetical protein
VLHGGPRNSLSGQTGKLCFAWTNHAVSNNVTIVAEPYQEPLLALSERIATVPTCNVPKVRVSVEWHIVDGQFAGPKKQQDLSATGCRRQICNGITQHLLSNRNAGRRTDVG